MTAASPLFGDPGHCSDAASDLHIHTLVSDGEEEPQAMLVAARELGLRRIAFTDHDAVGAYRHFAPDLFAVARAQGLDLVSGIELDSEFRGREVHVLGYGFDLADRNLAGYLESTQALRREKVGLQIEKVNRRLRRPAIDPEKVMLPQRDTLMKPHLVHILMRQGLFADYPTAARWLRGAARVPIVIPKLSAAAAVRLVVAAGGQAVLAHPGFLVREAGVDLEALLADLRPAGLAGMEIEYPYHLTSPSFPDPASEREMVEELRRVADRHRLFATRGSDAHTVAQLQAFHRRAT